MLICTACYPVLVLFPHWTVISICCSKTTPKYKREKKRAPYLRSSHQLKMNSELINRSNNDAAIWRWLRPASHRPPIRVKMLTGKERVCIGFLFHIFIFFSSTNNLLIDVRHIFAVVSNSFLLLHFLELLRPISPSSIFFLHTFKVCFTSDAPNGEVPYLIQLSCWV